MNSALSREPLTTGRRWPFRGIEALALLCIFVVMAGGMAPNVNESHYLTKARHFWNPQFGVGDLFLESKDAHWFFFLTLGWLANVFSFPVAAHLGRLFCWACLAASWCHLGRALSLRPWLSTLSGALFVSLLAWGHLSGEWVVGGLEAKCLAYACIFVALGQVVKGSWSSSWPWLGLSCAFHVVTGGWVTLTVILAFFLRKLCSFEKQTVVHQLIPLTIGGLISLLGLIPAIGLNWGTDSATSEWGAKIYVFDRLPHHLLASHFSSTRWQAFGILFAASIACAVVFFRRVPSRVATKSDPTSDYPNAIAGIQIIWIVAGMAFLLACVGAAIDWTVSATHPALAASLLRYYWFRWNDVACPLAMALTLAVWHSSLKPKSMESLIIFALMAVPSCVMVGWSFKEQMGQRFPAADVQSLLLRTEPDYLQERTYRDWRAVCDWIARSTPRDAIWLTPRYQQTFKWYARRAEFVCWKDSPQDATGLVAWRNRLREAYTYSESGALVQTPEKQLLQLHQKYRIKYLLIDRRIQKTPPLLPVVYPVDREVNDTYMVFEFIDVPELGESKP